MSATSDWWAERAAWAEYEAARAMELAVRSREAGSIEAAEHMEEAAARLFTMSLREREYVEELKATGR